MFDGVRRGERMCRIVTRCPGPWRCTGRKSVAATSAATLTALGYVSAWRAPGSGGDNIFGRNETISRSFRKSRKNRLRIGVESP